MKKGQKNTDKTKKLISRSRIGKYKGKDNPNWRGGRILIDGYWYVYSIKHPHRIKSGYVAEHRLIMEDLLGRYLKPQEVIHHKNGIITDNKKSNLILCKSTGEHAMRFHIKKDINGKFYV